MSHLEDHRSETPPPPPPPFPIEYVPSSPVSTSISPFLQPDDFAIGASSYRGTPLSPAIQHEHGSIVHMSNVPSLPAPVVGRMASPLQLHAATHSVTLFSPVPPPPPSNQWVEESQSPPLPETIVKAHLAQPIPVKAIISPPSAPLSPPPPPPPAEKAFSFPTTVARPPALPQSIVASSKADIGAGRSDSDPPPPPSDQTTASSDSLTSDTDGLTISEALQVIHSDNSAASLRMEALSNDLFTSRNQLISTSRANFNLERSLMRVDDEIKLLINAAANPQSSKQSKSTDSLEEAVANAASSSSRKLRGTDHAESASLRLFKASKPLYEELFFMLQSKPKYLALLARLMQKQPQQVNAAQFVQIVVLDCFGDAFDSYEERLLLSLFKFALKSEIESCSDRATLLRSNSLLTQMLSAYAKRGPGLGILRDILEKPLRHLCDTNRNANLEISPLKVYQQLIQEYETESGKVSQLNKDVKTDEEALANPQVRAVIETRVAELVRYCNRFLDQILAHGNQIPNGMRYICKILGELYEKRFGESCADASSSSSAKSTLRQQIQALQGGFIWLRFLNPVIVAPESVNFVSDKPSKQTRRNLILIAKILQNLSNGILFGEKESYMKPLNAFITANLGRMSAFFLQLTDANSISDVDDSLSIDKYMYSSSLTSNGLSREISLDLNQIFFMHQLLQQHKEQICLGEKFDPNACTLQQLNSMPYSANDPLAILLNRLPSSVPQQVPRDENAHVNLRFVHTRASRISTIAPSSAIVMHDPFKRGANAGRSGSGDRSGGSRAESSPLYLQAKTLLLSVLKRLPLEAKTKPITSLLPFLQEQKVVAMESNDHSLCDAVSNVCAMLSTLFNMKLITVSGQSHSQLSEKERAIDEFLFSCARDSQSRVSQFESVSKQVSRIESALQTVTNHHAYLVSRLELYEIYLKNVQSKQDKTAGSKKDKKDSTKAEEVIRVKSYSHAELLSMQLIHKIEGDYSPSILKHLVYTMEMKYNPRPQPHPTDASAPSSSSSSLPASAVAVSLVRRFAPRFFLSVHLKKGVAVPVLSKPEEISYEQLLQLQEESQPYLDIEAVQLNVNILLNFLNSNFINHIKA